MCYNRANNGSGGGGNGVDKKLQKHYVKLPMALPLREKGTLVWLYFISKRSCNQQLKFRLKLLPKCTGADSGQAQEVLLFDSLPKAVPMDSLGSFK